MMPEQYDVSVVLGYTKMCWETQRKTCFLFSAFKITFSSPLCGAVSFTQASLSSAHVGCFTNLETLSSSCSKNRGHLEASSFMKSYAMMIRYNKQGIKHFSYYSYFIIMLFYNNIGLDRWELGVEKAPQWGTSQFVPFT